MLGSAGVTHPTYTHGRGSTKKFAVRADEGNAFFVGRSEIAGAVVVALGRRQEQAGEEVRVLVGTAFAIFQRVIVRSEELNERLYLRFVFCDLFGAFERLFSVTKHRNFVPQR